MIPWLAATDPFPPVAEALIEPAGLLAASPVLAIDQLIEAYRQGIFPWYSEGQPVLWWSTDPRMVLSTDAFHCSRSLRKTLRAMQANGIEVRCDQAFEKVMRACATPREKQSNGTWINEEMIAAYVELHRRSLAHSIETWCKGELIGGMYGVAIGKMFYGESMFSRRTNASKIALAHLVDFLRSQGYPMLDCQQQTAHLASLGARPISRQDFMRDLRQLTAAASLKVWPQRLTLTFA